MDVTTDKELEWASCFADPYRGVAFFDGITIESDPITDPRRDRVLPILKEEQILMCRQMRHALEPGALALDVGTGSGVFAIWAAKHGCRVLAVDKSPRAIRVARQNIEANASAIVQGRAPDAEHYELKVKEAANPREIESRLGGLAPGEICLVRDTFKEDFAERFQGVFDLVFLSPPYNPTLSDFDPAEHAGAGEDGQLCFNSQIVLVPKIISENGICIGNQMTPTEESDSYPKAIEKIAACFKKHHVKYADILRGGCPVEDFLRRQYQSFINGFAEKYSTTPDKDHTEKAISEAVRGIKEKYGIINPFWALIYYEIEVGKADTTVEPIKPHYVAPGITWQDRIRLHRDIIENTSEPVLLPSSSLFMQQGPVGNFPRPSKGNGESTEWEKSTLHFVDRWITRHGLLRGDLSPSKTENWSSGHRPEEPSLFDLIFVDTAPNFRNPAGKSGLKEECKAWFAGPESNHTDQLEQRKTKRLKLLKQWQRNTVRQQKLRIGPFLHPHFMGSNYPDKWTDIQYTFIEENVNDTNGEREGYKDLLEYIRRQLESAKNREEVIDLDDIEFDERNGYSWTNLEALEVQDTDPYKKEMKNRLDECKLDAEDEEDVKMDLEACHQVMHERVHEVFNETLRGEIKWSVLLGIPLSLADFPGDREEGDLLEAYRGGIWVFAGGSTWWALKHERMLLDLARLLWLLYNGKYNRMAVESRQEYAEILTASTFSHEVKRVLSALDGGWLVDPEKMNKTSAPDEPGGEDIKFLTDEDLDELDGWRIVPLPGIFDSVGRMLRLWTQTSKPSDVFSSEIPSTWKSYIENCWRLAKATLRSFAVRGADLNQQEDFKKAQRKLRYVDELPSPQLCWSGEKESIPQPALGQSDSDVTVNWMHLTRLLVAIFGNCLQHGYHDEPVHIYLSIVEEGLSIKVENIKISEDNKKSCFPEWVANQIDQFSFSPLVSDTGGTKIIEVHAKKLGAEVEIPDKDQILDGQPWIVKVVGIPASSLRNQSC